MQLILSAFALLLLASSVPVDVGKFDTRDFAGLITVERRTTHAQYVEKAANILGKRECNLSGQSRMRFDISVPYVALMEQSGALKRVVVKDIGCAPLETLVGQMVTEQAQNGAFPVRHAAGERWYASEVNFTQADPDAMAASADPDKMICKKSEPVLGTRLKTRRICKTSAEWKAYDADREQFRRELNNAQTCTATAC
jgi:hypothetical protein